MKCTYRLLVLVIGAVAASCLLAMLGITGDITKILLINFGDSSHSRSPTPQSLRSVLRPDGVVTKVSDVHTVSPQDLGVIDQGSKEARKPIKKGNQKTLSLERHSSHQNVIVHSASSPPPVKRLVLAVVCCGERLNETQIMLKSAAVLSRSSLTMIVFTEDHLKPMFTQMVSSWPEEMQRRVTLEVHSITFPPGQDAAAWRKLFKPCASQRLFMPSLLSKVDALVYVDTDVLFLAPLEELWNHFSAMNSSHMAAMAPEHEDLATGWYNRFAKHPYYGRLGVNSGVMLMNLTRMRTFGWEEYVVPIYKHYKQAITWGDQDIINIIFHFYPDKLYVYGCEYNLRPDHCMYMSVCKAAEKRGVFVLHGNRGTFHNDKQPAFRAVFQAWKEYKIGADLRQDLYYPMQRYLLKASNTTCGWVRRFHMIRDSSMLWGILQQAAHTTVNLFCSPGNSVNFNCQQH